MMASEQLDFGFPEDKKFDLTEIKLSNSFFGSDTLVLAKSENSDLLPISKPCSQEFFGRIFSLNGPLWEIYAKTRLGFPLPQVKYADIGGEMLPNLRYVNFLDGRMYFLRNFELKFLQKAGMEKKFAFHGDQFTDKNWRFETVPPINMANMLSLLSSPINMLGNALDLSLLPLFVNEKMREFEQFHKESLVFYDKNLHIVENPIEIANKCLDGAVKAMEYSFVSSIAASFKTPLQDSTIWKDCEAQALYEFLKDGKIDEAMHHFGFHSDSPYDISSVRFWESDEMAGRLMQTPPKDKYARWRENSKFICSRYLSLMRDSYIILGEDFKLGGKVFYLNTDELAKFSTEQEKWREEIRKRQANFENYQDSHLPPTFVNSNGIWYGLRDVGDGISGISVGSKIDVDGVAVLINENKDYRKDVSGKIIISKTFSPNLASLLGNAKGIISSSGGALAHSAIIARELGLPCLVQVKNIDKIKEGSKIRLDGTKGKILLS
jgi:phosphohistidine swiveling domain-containing protein